MKQAVSQPMGFRHVVFPDSAGGRGRALNVAPRTTLDDEADAAPPPVADPLPPECEALFRWLFARAGVNYRHYKPETLGRRLPACLRAVRATSARQARAILRRDPELIGPAMDALLIGVTSFFRDDAVFDDVRRRALPELVRRWRAGGGVRPLRVWSVGCSNGAELYSVALLLIELGALWPGRCELVGTDCRREALALAASGAFEPAALKAVPPVLLRQYFAREGDHYRLRADVRSIPRWSRRDALGEPEPGLWDLVLCRNVAIYLQPDATSRLWASLAGALRPGGLLVLGKAERPLGVRDIVPLGPCLYRKVGT